MGQAESELFAGCHWLFVNGMRAAVESRLRGVYGDHWWVRGVMPGVTGKGENLSAIEQLLQKQTSLDGRVNALDAAALRQVVHWNYGLAFKELFSNGRKAHRDMGKIVGVRNEWAHGRDVSDKKLLEAINLMQDALSLMEREEAIEVGTLMGAYMAKRGFATGDEIRTEEDIVVDVGDSEEDGAEFISDAPGASLLGVWGDLRSFLAIETEFRDVIGGGGRKVVNVRVTNTAPISHDMPLVRFLDVRVNAGDSSVVSANELEPGRFIEGQYECLRTAVAGVQFKIDCRIDRDSLLQVRQIGGFAAKLVEAAIDGFVAEFSALGIKAFVEDCQSVMSAINANMTLGDASAARERINDMKSTALRHVTSMQELNVKYKLGIDQKESEGHPFWRDCRSLVKDLRAFSDDLEGLHKAIGETDMDMLDRVIKDLTGQQMAIMRVEALIRDRRRQ